MKSASIIAGLAALASASTIPTTTVKDLPKRAEKAPIVTISGNAFYAGDERFYIRGVDYQPGGSGGEIDPLSDIETCKRDLKEFVRLGINTVRVYMVDNSKNHKECMDLWAENGIYLVLDVNTPEYSLNRIDPYLSYNGAYLQNVFATIDQFVKYDNTLAFFSGNEVINDEPGTVLSAPFIKAVTRDIRSYIKARGYRKVPVGYSATDVNINLMETAFYMNCGDEEVRSDFFAYNDYSWCKSDFKTARWDEKVKNFTDYGIPVFLSEWGCITNGRDFEEMGALMSDKMTPVFSGGLMYEYTMEANGYGIVKAKNGKIEELEEFGLYAKALKKYPSPKGDGGASKTSHSVTCPSMQSHWEVDPNKLPAMPQEAKKFFTEGAGKGNGFGGKGSQTAGDTGLSQENVTVKDTGVSSSSSSKDGSEDSAAVRLNTLSVSATALFITALGAALL